MVGIPIVKFKIDHDLNVYRLVANIIVGSVMRILNAFKK